MIKIIPLNTIDDRYNRSASNPSHSQDLLLIVRQKLATNRDYIIQLKKLTIFGKNNFLKKNNFLILKKRFRREF